MNKQDIKTKWGHYADTDKLVDHMMELLTKYGHRNTEHGVCCILERFFSNKEPLIKLIQKSEYYIGDLRIVLDEQIERRTNELEVRKLIDTFPSEISACAYIKKTTDSNGKTMTDYLKVGKQKVSIADFDNQEFISNISAKSVSLSEFTSDGYTVASEQEYKNFINALRVFRQVTSSTMSDEHIANLTAYKIHDGMKTSRAFNKICHQHGVDKAPLYNKEFAKYSDMVSGLKRNIKFFISVNPLDYLTMSFGVNWASCHTIDKSNRRHMENSYSGQYCGGTMSYMLDKVSIITYVHNTMPENHETGKVYRNMFHLGEDGLLLQGRIYPQGNDGCTDLYKEFRLIMQRGLSNVLGLDNNKWIKRSSVSNVDSIGAHYRDYLYNSECNISYPAERPQCTEQSMTVGCYRICPYCGESAEDLSAGKLSHNFCSR